MVTDPVSDLMVQIKNAGMVKKSNISLPYSRLKYNIAQKLRVNNFVSDVREEGHGFKKNLVIDLMYDREGRHKMSDFKRISKPGRRVYLGTKEIFPQKQGYGVLLLSTPKGVLTDTEARKEHVGGEALFSIW